MANEKTAAPKAGAKIEELKQSELETVAGGNIWNGECTSVAVPNISEGYLPLRNAPYENDANEIAMIWPNNRFYVDLNERRSGSGEYCKANYNGLRGLVRIDLITVISN